MKVLHAYKQYYPDFFGGIEQVIFQIAEETNKLGVKSEVFTLSSNPNPETISIKSHIVHRAKKRIEIASTPFSISAISKFRELAKEVDLIHYQFPNPFNDALHLLGRVKKPYIVSYQSDIIKQKYLLSLYTPLMKHFLNNANLIVASSPNYLKTSKVLQQFKEKTVVIPNGICEETYPKVTPNLQESIKAKYGSKFFLFVGALRYYKGLFTLLESARSCDYPIVIAGVGGIEEQLKEKAKELKLRNVFFTGEVSEELKSALYHSCYSFVFPSQVRSEAFGISLLEAAMFRKPLISCEIGTGTTYINQHNQTGIVIPPNSPKKLLSAMKCLWDAPEKASEMGTKTRERYEELFTAKIMAKSYYQAYKEVLKKHSS